MRRVLITGAAGYLGRSTAYYLVREGYTVVGIDDYSTSQRADPLPFEIHQQDLRDFQGTFKLVEGLPPFDGVIHFAAKALVPESFQIPHVYFENNIQATLTMLETCHRLKIPAFVHSSTCAVYGLPKETPILEDTPLNPISPYGESKRCAEQLISQYTALGTFKAFALRYFNPAGAIKGSGFGECHDPETHLVPRVINAAVSGNAIEVFGKDYPTPDGTCIRDFVHVEDLSAAHQKALEHLAKEESERFKILNVGTGIGVSVLEVIRTAEKACKKRIEIKWSERRKGDPPALVADVRNFKALFGWVPGKTLAEMVEDQWTYSLTRHK